MTGAMILASLGFLGILGTAVTALHWLLKGHRETVELLIKNNQEISTTFEKVQGDPAALLASYGCPAKLAPPL